MMKHIKKLLSALVLMLGLATFAACSNDNDDTEVATETEATTETEVVTEVEEVQEEPTEGTEEEVSERSELFEEHREWAIGRIDVMEENLDRDSVVTARLMLSGLSDGISGSLDNLPDFEIRILMTELGMHVDNLLEGLEGAQPLIDAGQYDDEYVLNMFGDVIRPRLVEMREELEAME